MLKRIYETLAVVLMLAGLGGALMTFQYLRIQKFIESLVAGVLSFVLLRTGLFVLRLMVARSAIADSHERILDHVHGSTKKEQRK